MGQPEYQYRWPMTPGEEEIMRIYEGGIYRLPDIIEKPWGLQLKDLVSKMEEAALLQTALHQPFVKAAEPETTCGRRGFWERRRHSLWNSSSRTCCGTRGSWEWRRCSLQTALHRSIVGAVEEQEILMQEMLLLVFTDQLQVQQRKQIGMQLELRRL